MNSNFCILFCCVLILSVDCTQIVDHVLLQDQVLFVLKDGLFDF